MLCLAQYSRRVIPLLAKPSTMPRISCLLRIPPFSTASLAQSRWVPQTLTIDRYTFLKVASSRLRVQDVMHRHLFALMRQVLIGAACNRLHTIEQRCARWLLMTHDHAGQD